MGQVFAFCNSEVCFYDIKNSNLQPMSNNEFLVNLFVPNDNQQKLIEAFINIRKKFGKPEPAAYQRSLERTQKFTRTVYPLANKVS